MACNIRQNNDIKVFRLKGIRREIKISQYVDDSTICTRDHESIPHVIETIEEFGKIAGPRLNRLAYQYNRLKFLIICQHFYKGSYLTILDVKTSHLCLRIIM